MSDLLTQFESECDAADVKPTDALRAGGVHASLWYKWRENKVSPTLVSFEKARNGLRQLRDRVA